MKFDILNRWSRKSQFTAEIECAQELRIGAMVRALQGIDREHALRIMSRALAGWRCIDIRTFRLALYRRAECSNVDAEACQLEAVRREVMGDQDSQRSAA